ncbi:fungal-specific transcription factor domain-containing protein [Dactylonectria macrodidyma]|uniref:Fungal-specific transcription factor domain-containing protein n=1 Tax=Dactylonectria macrodidyma TaxID=307937 RepID=A0A9P9E2N7_9HYPO|nr:fungal-specific transcription factor domain-containing protein [Dactylonectria macrodidyma]
MEGRNKRYGDGSATTDTSSNLKSTRASRQRGHRKFRGLTCASCRTRKVRCEGSQPACKTCELYHVECRYDKPPPLSQVVAMARRLQEAESMIEQLQGKSSTADATRPRSSTGDGGLPDASTHSPVPVLGDDSTDLHVPLSLLPTDLVCEDVGTASPAQQSLSQPSVSTSRNHTSLVAAPEESLSNDLSLDEHGKICYYGPTSAVHQPVDLDSPSAHSSSGHGKQDDARSYLTSHAQESAIWEEFALGNAAIQTGLSRSVMARLLHLHWTWVAPMFMWVYRPAFVRDMTTGGRYYSEFLLLVLCAHASRYQDSHHSELLSSRVRLLLGDAIQKPSSIPTVQALLQLSARELAHGSISQAWLYSGMAFRMAGDLGLQHTGPDIAGLKGLSPIDLEIRRRLFWSCYFWDKAISLYTGRLPAVTELPQNPIDFIDDTAESDTWSPYYEDSSALTRLAPGQYPSMKSHAVSCFANSCKLSVIINDIIVQIYSRRSRLITEGALQNIKRCLDTWRAESPAHLRYDPDYLPAICPPPHIMSQNILYFATVILAHRPFWPAPAYYRVCIRAAQGMEKLLLLLESTFSFDNITYLMGYCIYTGASAILEDAKSNQGTAHPTMQTFLRALNGGMRKCPLLERSLHIIIKGLKRASEHRAVPDQRGVASASFDTNSYIPAFPYFDTMSPNDMDMDVYLNSMNMDAMATLDCYPELQIDLDTLIGQGPA